MKKRLHKRPNNRGFGILDFLITFVSLFAGLYFIFWAAYFGCNYFLARFYLDNFTFCELKITSTDCWHTLKRQIHSLKFVDVKKLHLEKSSKTKTVSLIFDYTLPTLGLSKGVGSLELSSSINEGAWR